jgi:predicted ArsR family transcriptional regulator
MTPAKKRRLSDDDLGPNDPRRSTKARLVKLLTDQPDIRPKEAAERLGISMTRVKQLATDAGFEMRWTKIDSDE